MVATRANSGNANLRQSGFSLIELAVVLMIIGTLLGGVLVAVGTSLESGRRTNTQNQLRQIEDAIYGFAQTQGRLPCPASDGTGGLEQVPDGTTGACPLWHGFVPATTLGLFGSVDANGLLLDPWQNPYRYSVAQYSFNGRYVFTHPATLRDFFSADPPVPVSFNDGDATDPSGEVTANMLAVSCSPPKCHPTVMVTISDTIPALLLSMGPNWPTFSAATSDAWELANAEGLVGALPVPGDNVFVDSEYREDVLDDQLLWLSPYVLFNRMVSAGRLP